VGAEPRVGLCESCEHARCVRNARGSSFWLCGLHERDPRFLKYPPLPVHTCAGHAPKPVTSVTNPEPEKTP
jgi:hypothetical protein